MSNIFRELCEESAYVKYIMHCKAFGLTHFDKYDSSFTERCLEYYKRNIGEKTLKQYLLTWYNSDISDYYSKIYNTCSLNERAEILISFEVLNNNKYKKYEFDDFYKFKASDIEDVLSKYRCLCFKDKSSLFLNFFELSVEEF